MTEIMTGTDLLDKVFPEQSPSDPWKILRVWLMPRSIATQIKWSQNSFNAVNMEKGEKP